MDGRVKPGALGGKLTKPEGAFSVGIVQIVGLMFRFLPAQIFICESVLLGRGFCLTVPDTEAHGGVSLKSIFGGVRANAVPHRLVLSCVKGLRVLREVDWIKVDSSALGGQ